LAAFSKPIQPQDDSLCVLCEFVVTQIEAILGDNATDQQIIQAVEHICDILPKTVRPQCKNFIEQNGQALINALINNLPPHQCCVAIGICKNRNIPTPKMFAPRDNNMCSMCMIFVQLAEAYLAQNSTIQQIEDILKAFPCSLFGTKFEQQCDAFVEQYIPQLINQLVNNEPPTVACKQMQLCN